MLDEIINYVQSLQRQVEVKNTNDRNQSCSKVNYFGSFLMNFCFSQFLSMKLASMNPRMDFSMDALLSKHVSWSLFFTQILMQKLSYVSLSYIDADVSISWISTTYTLPTRFFDDIPFWASARAASI